jgi:hypothetical protein
MTNQEKSGLGALIGAVIVVALIVAAVVWVVSSLGHVLGLTPTYDDVMGDHPAGWVAARYENVALGYILTLLFIGLAPVFLWLGVRALSEGNEQAQDARTWLRRLMPVATMFVLAVVALPVGAIETQTPVALAATSTAEADSAPALAPQDSADEANKRASVARERAGQRAVERRVARRRAAARRERARVARARRERLKRERLAVAAMATPEPTLEQSACDPNYEGACLDADSSDYDCAGGSGDGPDYTGTVTVVGTDIHDLDRNGDGTACDS